MIITNYEAKIELNGSEIPDWTGFLVTDRLGVAEIEFEIDLRRPISVPENSTVTISDGLGDDKFDLVTDRDAEYIGGNVYSTTIKGVGSNITRKASPKSIYFVNKTWLDSLYPGYVVKNGIIFNGEFMEQNLKSHGVSVNRLFLQELPGKNQRDSEIECIVAAGVTYHDILENVLGRIGFTVEITLPNIDVQKTLALQAGSTYFSIIQHLYGNWNPIIKIEGTTVKILDVGNDNQARPKGTGVYSLSEDSFSIYNWNITRLENTVDHLVINGPSIYWTYKGFKGNRSDKLMLEKKDLIGETAVYVTEIDYSEEPKYLDAFMGQLKSDIAFEYSNLIKMKNTKSVRTIETKINTETDDEVVIKETTKTYDYAGNLTKKTIIEKFYYDYETPVGSRIEEYARYGSLNAGQSEEYSGEYLTYVPDAYSFGLVSVTEEQYGTFVGDTGMVETQRREYRRCISYSTTIKNDDGTFTVLQNPQPVHIINQIGIPTYEYVDPTDADASRWQEDLCLYAEEEVRLNIMSPRMLMKSVHITKYIPIKSEFSRHEDIPLRRRQVLRDYVEHRWEFFYIDDNVYLHDGEIPPNGSFYPKVEIYEPDVIDQDTAERIANRFLAARQSNNVTATILTTTPLWGLQVGSTVKLPECSKEYFDYDTQQWTSVDVPSRYFWVIAKRRVCKFKGDVDSAQREFDVYDELDLRQYY